VDALKIGNLIRITSEINYAYNNLIKGSVGLVYNANEAKTRYAILLNDGTKGEITRDDIEQNRIDILS
jgi:hypothetical protein|tara:strand:- start:521 stop:724 length:204 start_codon:yes stop_codon:yes gene_type:complete